MRKIDLPLTIEGKGHKNKKSTRGKMFGYQVLGFGSGGGAAALEVDYLVVAGGGGGGFNYAGAGGAGGLRTSWGSGSLDSATPLLMEKVLLTQLQ